MARHYARFDGGTETNLGVDYFEKCKVSDGSTTATDLRNGLIDSRSLVDADVMEDLDAVNKNGALGTYFPPNSPIFTTNNSTFVSWSSAYTSSVNGIKTPTTNAYATLEPVNYSLRPTASVLSTMTTLVGEADPPDPVGVSYNTYTAAATAVTAVLNAIRSGSDTTTNRGPFARLGNYPSRTLHSLWNNPDLTYFAWDDFTPGTPQSVGITTSGSTITDDSFYFTNDFSFNLFWAGNGGPAEYTYKADEISRPVVSASFETSAGSVRQTFTQDIMTAGAFTKQFTVLASNINTDGEHYLYTNVKYRDNTLYSQTPSLNSDGTAVAGSQRINLTRLYGPFIVKLWDGSGALTNCASFTGSNTNVYPTGNWDSTTVTLLHKVYLTTNSGPEPAGLETGTYRIVTGTTAADKIISLDAAGTIGTIETTCV